MSAAGAVVVFAAVFAHGLLAADTKLQSANPSADRLLPERFLREYDPVTVFFAQERGPRGGGPGDDASKLLSISPAHPGEYRWLDSRTLQFLPAESWPALRTFIFKTPAGSFSRSTLLSPPVSVTPAHGSTNLASIQDITLGFATPVPLESLADMIVLEVRNLPGLGSQAPTLLGRRDFTIKELDRIDRKSAARYIVRLNSPIGDGKSVALRVRLSLDEGIPGSAAVYEYTTRTDFRLLSFGTGSTSYPVSISGSVYSADQAINCGTGANPLVVQFSEALDKSTSIAALKAFAAFTPAVRNLRFEISGQRLLLYFDRDPDTDYRLELKHQALKSASGRTLSVFAPSSFHFYYKALSPYIKWNGGQAILERFGPQSLPMEARGVDKIDLRIHSIDPLDLNYWPFPESVVVVDEKQTPPMPGEEPAYGAELVKQIRLLGSPDFSEIVSLPTKEKGGAASFGVDLLPIMKKLGREGASGAYLVGYRRLGADTARNYMRIQVTDLCLTVVEERRGLVFAVTSLSTGKPVVGASISLDSIHQQGDGSYAAESLVSGKTDREGKFTYNHEKPLNKEVKRIVVSSQGDDLVVDTSQAPPYFHNNHWYGPQSRWLGWLTMQKDEQDLAAKHLAYLFTERPIYRADEAVHIQGFVRAREKGLIKRDDPTAKRFLVVNCPDGRQFRYKVELKGTGYFYHLFDEKDLPTGGYSAVLLDANDAALATVSFQKEDYRIPSFEINLNGPDRVPFDEPFTIELDAAYYAGGKVAGQSVEWSVSEGVWRVAPAAWPDYVFSTYLGVTGGYRDEGVSASEMEDVTDDDGRASLTIDPRSAQSIQSRYYQIQASVRGADAQTVSQSKRVLALPPFSIGLKLPRFETESMAVKGSIIVLDHLERPLAGKDLTLKLYERQWHSYLSESDITTGQAKYVSDVVDSFVLEKPIVSKSEAVAFDIPVENAGVYIVEIQGRDAVGRLQSVKSDLYIAGPTPVAWKRTTAAVFETSLDKKKYQSGDTARVLIQSPFQSATAFAVVERPAGNLYRWIEVKNGQGMIELAVTEDLVPRFPVHIILMRGRLPGSPSYEGGSDRLKPLSVANTTWITVDPSSNRVDLQLLHEPKSSPGSKFTVDMTLTDRDGKPVDGTVALWLVDRAVLALAQERFASPLSAFITDVQSAIRISDTRNLSVGNLPFEELAGGDMAEAMRFADILDKNTVRRNFQTVPYFNPAIEVKGGKGSVTIDMPDNLTEFAIRAVATSDADKFGIAKSTVAMRLPVVVQEALPRFVRPGDEIVAGGMARVVEGSGGGAQAQLELGGGLTLSDGGMKTSIKTELDAKLPTRLYFPLKAPLSLASKIGQSVSVTLGAQRLSDGAKDAFMIELPVRSDTIAQRLETVIEPTSGQTYDFPWPKVDVRKGATKQTLYLTAMPELVQILRSLRFQSDYPYGCTEQRIAKVHSLIALNAALGDAGFSDEMRISAVELSALYTYLESAITEGGLYAFYPGSEGRVYLTAYVVEFLVAAKAAGYVVPDILLTKPVQALKEALRSDYKQLVSGYSALERSMALCALAAAGYYDPSYAQLLLSLAQDADAYTKARIYLTLKGKKGVNASQLSKLSDSIQKSVVFKREGGGLAVAGLQEKRSWFGNPFLYSDNRTMAAVYSVYMSDKPKAAETKAILEYLLAAGGGDGWGDTYTTTCVIMSLVETIKNRNKSSGSAEIWDGKAWKSVDLKGRLAARISVGSDERLRARIKGSVSPGLTLYLETCYVSALPGSKTRAANEGFSVTREILDYGRGAALSRKMSASAGLSMFVDVGAVVEDHIQVYNPQNRQFVAIRVPLAAVFEPMNPSLATSPAEAKSAGTITIKPTYTDYEDDQVTFYYDSLPAGSFDFYYRARVNFEGEATLPPVLVQCLYELGVQGSSDGAVVLAKESNGGR
jgi:hypothetical protein